MGSTDVQSRETIQQRGATHDRETGSGVDKTPLQYGNHPHNLPNPDASRTDFSDRKTLLNGGAEKVLINQGLSGAIDSATWENNSLHVNITT